MAFYRGPQSPREEQFPSNPLSPPQRNPNRWSASMAGTSDVRGSLHRRFTTNTVPTLSPIGQQRRQAAGDMQQTLGALNRMSLGERKQRRYEELLDIQRRIQQELDSVDVDTRLEVDSNRRNEQTVTQLFAQSEPTTPPEYNSGFPTTFSRPNRYSATSLTSPPGTASRTNRSSIHLTSPPTGFSRTYKPSHSVNLPSQSVPGSRRQSDDEEEDDLLYGFENGLHRAAANFGHVSENHKPEPGSRVRATATVRYNNLTRYHMGDDNTGSLAVLHNITLTVAVAITFSIKDLASLNFKSSANTTFFRPNRNSMPITSINHRSRHSSDLALGPVNTAGFLFDEKPTAFTTSKSNHTSPADPKTFLQVQHTADGFPKLIRREENGDLTISAALDLASTSDANQQHPARATATRHRISLPTSGMAPGMNMVPLNGFLANGAETRPTTMRSGVFASPSRSYPNGPQMPTSSYSASAVPTLSSVNGGSDGGVSLTSLQAFPSNLANVASPEYNPSALARLVSHSNHASQDSSLTARSRGDSDTTSQVQSTLQGGATPFGPPSSDSAYPQSFDNMGMTPFNNPSAFWGSYMMPPNDFSSPPMVANGVNGGNGMNVGNGYGPMGVSNGVNGMPGVMHGGMNMNGGMVVSNGYGTPNGTSGYGNPNGMNGYGGMQNMNGSNDYAVYAPRFPAQPGNLYAQNGLSPYQQYPQHGRNGQAGPGASRHDNARAPSRRQAAEDAQAKFNVVAVDQLIGEIYTLCKDQHGCRFLQKKLEERDEATVKIIFDDVKNHVIELMVDPFGNYLCQKLFESANDEQRQVLIQNAAPAMFRIATNQHGTRALQKMIECIKTHENTMVIIAALHDQVISLIQDLNGNHVIQKCLNHLSSEDAQFIFNSVGTHCIAVGTHRHGCCVIQRCIDHADGLQKGEMVDHVIRNSLELVVDAFGNYVVQYILDLGEPCFTEPLCRAFLGSVHKLSVQKFSSNVVEKCIRVASPEVQHEIILEIMQPGVTESLLKDSYANYVIQTAMDFADAELKPALFDEIRRHVPALRNTPHGRRVGSKVAEYDNRHTAPESILSSLEITQPAAPPARANRQGMIGAPAQWANGSGFASNANSSAAAALSPPFGVPVSNNGHAGANGIQAPIPQHGNFSQTLTTLGMQARSFVPPAAANDFNGGFNPEAYMYGQGGPSDMYGSGSS